MGLFKKNVMLGTLRWMLLACLGVVVGVHWGCEGGGCFECTPGQTACTNDGAGITSCEPVVQGGKCYRTVLRFCQGGGQCQMTGLVPRCVSKTCGNESCAVGTVKCEGQSLLRCQADPVTQCTRFVAERVCTGSQCNAEQGRCVAVCEPKNPKFGERCNGNAVVYVNDCGQNGEVKQQCQATEKCEGARCVTDSCVAKELQASQKCVGNDIYYFDDCDKQRDLVKKCDPKTPCSDGKCQDGTGKCDNKNKCPNQGDLRCDPNGAVQACQKDPNSTEGCLDWSAPIPCASGKKCEQGKCIDADTCSNPCTTKDATKCVGDKVSICTQSSATCLQWSASTDCPNNGKCANDECPGGCPPPPCTENAKQCSGKDVQVCQKNAKGCLEWTTTQTCGANQLCQSGACKDQQQGGGGLGGACNSDADCNGATCVRALSPPGYFCGKPCTRDASNSVTCPSGQICITGYKHVGGNRYQRLPYCTKKCTASSECGGNSCRSTQDPTIKVCHP